MKHTKSFVSTIFFSLILAACSLTNSVEPPKQIPNTPSTEEKILVVAGVDSMSAARSAIPNGMQDANNFAYAAALYTTSFADTDLVVGTYDDGTKTVLFEFAKPTSPTGLTVEIFAFPKPAAGETLTPKTENALLSAKKTSLSVDGNTITVGDLKLLPYKPTGATGNVELSVALPSSDYLLAIRNTTDSTTFSCNQSGTTATISASDIPANAYTLVFLVNKSGATVYAWTETINVFNGMKTNAWLQADGTPSTSAKTISDVTITAAALTTFYVLGTNGTWYTSVLGSSAPTEGNDSNSGALMKPLQTVQAAINKVTAANDGSSQYTIYVDGEFTAESGGNVAKIEDVDKALKLSIIGLGSSKAVFKGSGSGGSANVIRVRQNDLTLNLENLKLMSADVQKNSAYGAGGGLHLGDNLSAFDTLEVTLKNCEISGNKARYGGGICFRGKTLELIDCIVNGNEADYGGGLLAYGGSVKLTKVSTGTIIGDSDTTKTTLPTSSDFGNKATGNGGGITLSEHKVVLSVGEGCYINRNYCNGQQSGGGICIQSGSEVTVASGAYIQYNFAECTIDAENKTTNGGGINIASTQAKVTVAGNIIGNKISITSTKTTSANGGGIYNGGGTLTLSSTAKIEGNSVTAQLASGADADATVTTNGGGIYTTSAITIPDGVEISGNNAKNGGGVYLKTATDAETKITGGIIKGNAATVLGGALAVQTGKLTISGTAIIGGETDADANTANKGGAIFSQDVLNINGGSIKGNKAIAAGGAIYALGKTTIDGSGVSITGNSSNLGGAIWTASELLIKNGTIDSNIAKGDTGAIGGAIHVTHIEDTVTYHGKVTVSGGTISNNQAVYTGNTASAIVAGGAIYVNTNAELEISNGIITGNKTSDENNVALFNYGGAIFTMGVTTISGGTFTKNISKSGGAIMGATGSTINISGTTIVGGTNVENANVATVSGGAIHSAGTLNITGGEISYNRSSAGAGIYVENSSEVTISGGKINSNLASMSGGAIYISSESGTNGIVNISEGEFIGNFASGLGGAIFNYGTLNMSGAAKIVATAVNNNDVFLYPGFPITLIGDISTPSPAVTISVPTDQYKNTNQVLTAMAGTNYVKENCAKFQIIGDTSGKSWKINASGYLEEDANTTTLTIEEVINGSALNSINSGNVLITGPVIDEAELNSLCNEIYQKSQTHRDVISIHLVITDEDSAIDEIGLLSYGSGSVFDDCYCLVSITIPKSVKKITSGQFTTCKNLKSITFSNTSDWYYDDSGTKQTIDVSDPEQNATKLIENGVGTGDWKDKELKRLIFSTSEIDSATKDTISPSVTLESLDNLEALKNSVLTATNKGVKINLKLTVTIKNQAELETLATYIDNGKMTQNNNIDKLFIDLIITDDSTIEKIGESSSTREGVFNQRTYLKSVTLPAGLKEITDAAFFMCGNLETVSLPASMTTIGKEAFKNCTGLKTINLLEGITTIGDYAFASCSALQNISLPSSLEIIDEQAFYGCEAITQITIPENVTKIGKQAFYDCNFTTVEFESKTNWYKTSEYDYTGGTSIGVSDSSQNAAKFKDSSDSGWKEYYLYRSLPVSNAIEVITSSDNAGKNISIKIDMQNATSTSTIWQDLKTAINDTSAASVKLDLDDVNSLPSKAFESCTKLESIELKGNLTSVPSQTFASCTNLKKVVLPDSVTKIESSAFNGCTKLEEIKIPDNVTSIGQFAFTNCTSLTTITLPSKLTTIGNRAFQVCSLTSIIIPYTVTRIGQYAFFPGYIAGTSDLKPSTLTSIVFENQTNWKHTTNENYNSGTNIVVNDSSENVDNLTNTYVEEYWYRED